MSSASVNLKVCVVDLDTTKTLQFSSEMSVHEACLEIRTRLGQKASGQDHGLFWLEGKVWLAPTRLLSSFDFRSGESTVEFRKRHRPQRIKLSDSAVKTILIDESANVKDLVTFVCERIGIMNPEEYSFQKLDKDDKKEATWLNPDKSLPEQDLKPNDMVALMKKFFFSDQTVDRQDPVQLNLLYNQSRNAIVQGKYPINAEEAVQFAALQCQITLGNHEPGRHKPGFARLKDYLPVEYRKNSDVEKAVWAEHAHLHGLTDLNAKFRYVSLCRSLKTFGITFFLCKEKNQKKNKMEPVLLGVTKTAVVKLDVETKQVQRTFPLQQLRRWAATNNTFTLDFGDYADAFYSVHTSEGEQISQLISGYVAMILKNRREAEKAIEEDAARNSAQVTEEWMQGRRGVAVHRPNPTTAQETKIGLATLTVLGQPEASTTAALKGVVTKAGTVRSAQISIDQSVTKAGMDLQQTLTSLTQNVQFPRLPTIENNATSRQQTLDVNCENVNELVQTHLADVSGILNGVTKNTLGDASQMENVNRSVTQMPINVSMITEACKTMVGLNQDLHQVLDAAKSLADKTYDFLQAVHPAVGNQDGARDALFEGGLLVAQACRDLLQALDIVDSQDQGNAELINLTKQLRGETRDLVLEVGKVASLAPYQRDKLLTLAHNHEILTENAHAVSGIVAHCLSDERCAQVFEDVVGGVKWNVAQLTDTVCDAVDDYKRDATTTIALRDAANRVAKDLELMLQTMGQFKDTTEPLTTDVLEKLENGQEVATSTHVDGIYQALKIELDGMGQDPTDVTKAKHVARLTNIFANLLNTATSSPTENMPADKKGWNRGDTFGMTRMTSLLSLADLGMSSASLDSLTDNSPTQDPAILHAKLKEAAQALVSKTVDFTNAVQSLSEGGEKGRVLEYVKDLQDISLQAVRARLTVHALKKLAKQARNVSNAVKEVVAHCQTFGDKLDLTTGTIVVQQLKESATQAAMKTPALVSAIRGFARHPMDVVRRLRLINESKSVSSPVSNLVASAKLASNGLAHHPEAQTTLVNLARNLALQLQLMASCLQTAEGYSTTTELEAALRQVEDLNQDLENFSQEAQWNPLPSQNVEQCSSEMTTSLNAVLAGVMELKRSAFVVVNEKRACHAASDVANALTMMEGSVQGLCSLLPNHATGEGLIQQCLQVVANVKSCLESAQESLTSFSDPDSRKFEEAQNKLSQVISQGLEMVSGLDETMEEISEAIQTIQERSNGLKEDVQVESLDKIQLQTTLGALQMSMTGLKDKELIQLCSIANACISVLSVLGRVDKDVRMVGVSLADAMIALLEHCKQNPVDDRLVEQVGKIVDELFVFTKEKKELVYWNVEDAKVAWSQNVQGKEWEEAKQACIDSTKQFIEALSSQGNTEILKYWIHSCKVVQQSDSTGEPVDALMQQVFLGLQDVENSLQLLQKVPNDEATRLVLNGQQARVEALCRQVVNNLFKTDKWRELEGFSNNLKAAIRQLEVNALMESFGQESLNNVQQTLQTMEQGDIVLLSIELAKNVASLSKATPELNKELNLCTQTLLQDVLTKVSHLQGKVETSPIISLNQVKNAVQAIQTYYDSKEGAIKGCIAQIQQQVNQVEPLEASPAHVIDWARQVALAISDLIKNVDDFQALGQVQSTLIQMLRCSGGVDKVLSQNSLEPISPFAHHVAGQVLQLLQGDKTKEAAKLVAEAVSKLVSQADQVDKQHSTLFESQLPQAEREMMQISNDMAQIAERVQTMLMNRRQESIVLPLAEEGAMDNVGSIAIMTSNLVRAATVVQREIAQVTKLPDHPYHNDGTWSEGLVSAAKQVCEYVNDLCESVHQTLQGKLEPERAMAAAKGVASSTQQLVSAATVSVVPNSKSQEKLKFAAVGVRQATDDMIVTIKERMIPTIQPVIGTSRLAELEAQALVMKLEQELERARQQLFAIRRERYSKEEQ